MNTEESDREKLTELAEAFARLLELSNQLRPEYRDSLGVAPENLDILNGLAGISVPDLATVIYRSVAGTHSATKNQFMVDLIPGYRLIHYSELPEAVASVKSITGESELFPILANYSSDFVAVRDGQI